MLLHSTGRWYDNFSFNYIKIIIFTGSEWRKYIEGHSQNFKDISNYLNVDAAKLIHADGIHILFNLNGYTKGFIFLILVIYSTIFLI